MSGTEDRKFKAAEELASEMDERENARLDAEQRELKNLNQGMDATGHDAKHAGVNWGPSYRTKRKGRGKPDPKAKK